MVSVLQDDQRMVFAIGQTMAVDPTTKQNIPLLIMGITKKSFHFLMKGDNFQQFDFTRQGLATYMLVIAGETRAHVLDKMSVYMPGPKVADMHSDNIIPQDEQAVPKMRERARAYNVDLGDGVPHYPLAYLSDEELDRLFKSILGVTDGP